MLNLPVKKISFIFLLIVNICFIYNFFRSENVETQNESNAIDSRLKIEESETMKSSTLPTSDNHMFKIRESSSDIELNLSAEIFKLVNKCISQNVQLILLEPCYLLKLSTKEEIKLLKERKFITDQDFECKKFPAKSKSGQMLHVTFAIHSSQVNILFDVILQMKYDIIFKDEQSSHILIKPEKKLMVHVVTLFDRSKFWMIKQLDQDKNQNQDSNRDKDNNLDIIFRNSNHAFDKFDLLSISLNHQGTILIPVNISSFLFQLKYSKFIECNHELAEEVKLIRQDQDPDNEITGRMLQSIKVLKVLESSLLIPLWLDGGSLLGWNRECGSLPHDHDIDLMTYLDFNLDNYDIIEQMSHIINMPWSLQEIYAFPWEALQVRLWNFSSRWGFDIFYAYGGKDKRSKSKDDNNHVDDRDKGTFGNDSWIVGYHCYPFTSFCKLSYPYQSFADICSADLHGYLVHVPCNPDIIHEAEYGPSWKKPSADFIINNGICNDFYLPSESAYSYQCLGLNNNLFKLPRVTMADNSSFISHKDRKQNQLSDNFNLLGKQYYQFCQSIKHSQWIYINEKDYHWPDQD